MLIEFLLGILICIPLIPFNDLILKWAEKDHKIYWNSFNYDGC